MSPQPEQPSVIKQVDSQIATLTLNRPDARNVLNPELCDGLCSALQDTVPNPGIRVIVIDALGPSFMAGGDIRFFAQLLARDDGNRARLESMFASVHDIIRLIRDAPKPVIASVSGSAAGFGLSLALACDMVIAERDTLFTLAYCHLGVSPDGGSTWSLPRIIGLKKALELAMLGDRFDADEALQLGLVNHVVEAGALRQATLDLATRLAAGPSQALALTKALLNQSLHTPLDEQLAAEQRAFIACTKNPDFAEGVDAFLAKRTAEFKTPASTAEDKNKV